MLCPAGGVVGLQITMEDATLSKLFIKDSTAEMEDIIHYSVMHV